MPHNIGDALGARYTTARRDAPERLKKLDSSLLRRIEELFVTITQGFWRSAGSYFQDLPIKKKPIPGTEPLRQLRPLKTSSVTGYCNALQSERKDFQVITNFLHDETSSNLEVQEGVKYFAIPVEVKSTIGVNHIVTFFVDVEKGRIEYFDSKGLTLKDRTGKVRNKDSLTVSDVAEKISKEFGINEVWENRNKAQFDSHNCGVYVLDYITRRLGGESSEDVVKKPLPYEKANGERRKEFFKKIVEDYRT